MNILAIIGIICLFTNHYNNWIIKIIVFYYYFDCFLNLIFNIIISIRESWGKPYKNHYSDNIIHWDYHHKRMYEDQI